MPSVRINVLAQLQYAITNWMDEVNSVLSKGDVKAQIKLLIQVQAYSHIQPDKRVEMHFALMQIVLLTYAKLRKGAVTKQEQAKLKNMVLEFCILLINSSPKIVKCSDYNAITLLDMAFDNALDDLVLLLLQKGALVKSDRSTHEYNYNEVAKWDVFCLGNETAASISYGLVMDLDTINHKLGEYVSQLKSYIRERTEFLRNCAPKKKENFGKPITSLCKEEIELELKILSYLRPSIKPIAPERFSDQLDSYGTRLQLPEPFYHEMGHVFFTPSFSSTESNRDYGTSFMCDVSRLGLKHASLVESSFNLQRSQARLLKFHSPLDLVQYIRISIPSAFSSLIRFNQQRSQAKVLKDLSPHPELTESGISKRKPHP